MITNATLISATAAPTSDGKGGQTVATAVSIGVRCCLGEPKMSQRMTLQGKIADASDVMYAPRVIAAWPTFKAGQRVTVQLDPISGIQAAAKTMQIVHVVDRLHDAGESHWEIYLKSL